MVHLPIFAVSVTDDYCLDVFIVAAPNKETAVACVDDSYSSYNPLREADPAKRVTPRVSKLSEDALVKKMGVLFYDGYAE